MRTSPYGIHTDYIFGGLAAKRNRLREAQLWLDEASYYSSPRLLQVNPHSGLSVLHLCILFHSHCLQHLTSERQCIGKTSRVPPGPNFQICKTRFAKPAL